MSRVELKRRIVILRRGEVVEIDTWVMASGKNGMRRDWLLRDYKSGQILARATRYEAYFCGDVDRLFFSTFIVVQKW